MLDELSFFMQLDHPNCHYLLGAKTTLENGGILVERGGGVGYGAENIGRRLRLHAGGMKIYWTGLDVGLDGELVNCWD